MSEHWTQYDSEESILALKKILNQRDNKRGCIELLKAARRSEDFVAHIKRVIDDGGGQVIPGKAFPKFPEKPINENIFKGLSWKKGGENAVWSFMQDMSPVDACRPGLWLYMTLKAVEEGWIQSSYLAFNSDAGAVRIDKALKQRDDSYLECSRAILRRMFGAISERGTKGIFVDVPFARIWWQRHIAEEICSGYDKRSGYKEIPVDEMSAFFSEHKTVYEELTMRMSSNLTVIGDKSIRDGLMHFFFHEHKNNNFKGLVKRLGIMLAWRAMGALSVSENIKAIKEIAEISNAS